MTKSKSADKKDVGLKREMGLFSAVNIILAIMIGSGVFVSPTMVLRMSGSVGFSLIIWTSCGIVCLLGALAYAELSAVIPRSGAEYAYFVDAFTPLNRYYGGIPAFMCSWICVLMLRPAEVAIVTLTFGEYTVQPFAYYTQHVPAESMEHVKKLISILALGLITYINMTSVKLYVKVQNVFTVCKVAACLLVILGGIWWLSTGRTELLQKPFEGTISSPGNVALAFYSGLWSFDGWTSSTFITEEVKRPEVNILRSILIAVPLVTLLYVAMNLMYMAVLTKSEMLSAPAVAVLWAERVLPAWMGFAIPLGVVLATFGCGLSMQFGVSRLCYVAGQEGHVPHVFSFIHVERMTPAAAVALEALITLFFMFAASIRELIDLASLLSWVFYGMAMAALLVLRRSRPDVHRPYRVPTVIPWLVMFVAIFLAVTPIITNPSPMYIYILAFIVIGLGVHYQCVYKKRTFRLMRNFSYVIQVLCKVAPSQESRED